MGLPTREANVAFGKLSPAKPIFIYPVPGSHMIAYLCIFFRLSFWFLDPINKLFVCEIINEHYHKTISRSFINYTFVSPFSYVKYLIRKMHEIQNEFKMF